MKRLLFANVFLMLMMIAGCAQSMPAHPPASSPLVAHPPREFLLPPQEVALANAPFKKPKTLKPIVVLDAGHGGDDFGTHSLGTPKYQEKYLNMSTTLMVKGFLQKFGYRVLMTRHDDTFIPLDQRALFANERNPKLFVSIHFNSAPSRDAEGIEVFYFRNDVDKQRSAKSKELAQNILDKTVHHTQAKSRGVKHGNYAVLRETNMPAVLIEGGFLTNPDEMERIKDPGYLKNLAFGIAQGIQSYLATENVLAEN
jgi:N-acetylmuramoyl-L-alanine amidase